MTVESTRNFERRRPAYQRQIAVSAEGWSEMTGEPVIESHVWRIEPEMNQDG